MFWHARDEEGYKATYRLIIDVENVNQAPSLNNNFAFSKLGLQENNGVLQINEGDELKLELDNVFYDPDIEHGDFLSYEIKSVF